MIKDEVVVQIASNMTADQLQAAVRRLGLTVIALESLTNSGSTVVRLKITDGKTPAPPSDRSRMSAWPQSCSRTTSTTWTRQPPTRRPRRRGDTGQQGDAAQYILEKLKMLDVHRIVRGANVTIAVIDLEIDATHPGLIGVVAQRFSAVGAPGSRTRTATGMADAIAAHQRVLGTAPAAGAILAADRSALCCG